MENLLKLVSIWSVFWVKVSIFEKVPTHFSKCVFLDNRIFDKCDYYFMQKWLKMTHFCQKLFSQKRRTMKIFFDIGQYFLVFWEKVVSIVVSILTFFITDHSCHHCLCQRDAASWYDLFGEMLAQSFVSKFRPILHFCKSVDN